MSILDGMQILDSLTQEERDSLSNFCQERFIKEGEVLFREGDEANAMYILKTGVFEVSKVIDDEEVVLGKVRAEDMLGEMAIFGDTNKRMASAICIKDSVLITILSFSILEIAKNKPDLYDKIKQIINDRIMLNKMKEQKGC